ncbi:hypothetical protein Zmor_002332 [Zophobas morio]|uniref:Uncharacterized protein n=1 Tax=Zophobas morio TaxID=2755281 RepID=A0AA38MTI4_9CUCU|nr:hypothetical protein Zmor_002332 [Zophobas morio]
MFQFRSERDLERFPISNRHYIFIIWPYLGTDLLLRYIFDGLLDVNRSRRNSMNSHPACHPSARLVLSRSANLTAESEEQGSKRTNRRGLNRRLHNVRGSKHSQTRQWPI